MRQIIYTLSIAIVFFALATVSCKKSNNTPSSPKARSVSDIVGTYAGSTHFNEDDLWPDSAKPTIRHTVIDSIFPDTVWIMEQPGGNGIVVHFKNFSAAKTFVPLVDTFMYDSANVYKRDYGSSWSTYENWEAFNLSSNDSLSAEHDWAYGNQYYHSHFNKFLGKKL